MKRNIQDLNFWKQSQGNICNLSKILFICFILGFLFFIEMNHRSKNEERYGFSIRTPTLRYFIPCNIEVLMVWDIQPNGPFDKAGFKKRDIILQPQFNTLDAFLKSLDKPKGTVIEFEIIPFDNFEAKCDFDITGKTEKRIVNAP
jgi:hypothetical protein